MQYVLQYIMVHAQFSRLKHVTLVGRRSNLPGPLTNGLKCLRFWLRFRRFIPMFRSFLRRVNIPRGILPRRVDLPGVSYPGESISPEYHTPASQYSQGIMPRRVNLPWVWYPGQSIFKICVEIFTCESARYKIKKLSLTVYVAPVGFIVKYSGISHICKLSFEFHLWVF